jgi:hypothetical protein
MMDGKILVPSSAVAWVHKELEYRFQQRDVSEICRMFCEWLSKNPILPTEEQAQYMYDGKNGLGHSATIQYCMTEWQRLMFLAPEPKVPEEIKDLLYEKKRCDLWADETNFHIQEAFRRGQRSK